MAWTWDCDRVGVKGGSSRLDTILDCEGLWIKLGTSGWLWGEGVSVLL